MNITVGTLCLVVLFLSAPIPVHAANLYVSPTAGTNGDGSASNPWNLETALYPTAPVQPGDTVWLRGGVYGPTSNAWPAFESYLHGTTNAPIVVRAYPGERVILREHPQYVGTDAQTILYVLGSNTWFWGLEVASVSTTRITSVTGPNPSPSQLPLPSGVQVRAGNIKLINLMIHDTRGGLGLWQEAANSEVNGCLVYNNGWKELNGGGHGHGAYCQNSNGVMRLTDNIIFNQFANGVQGYTVDSQVRNLFLQRDAVFGNARIANYPQPDTGEQLVFGGSARIEKLNILSNYIFQSLAVNGVTIRTDFGGNANSNVTISGNCIAGGSGAGNFQITSTHYDLVVFTNNTLYSTNGNLLMVQSMPGYTINGNAYYGNGGQNFNNNGTSYSFANWKTATGFDSQSSYSTNTAPPDRVFVNANAYEPGRAQIVVFNWSGSNNVAVDVSSVLSSGNVYEVHNAQDYFASPVLSGTYDGSLLTLPMTNLTVAIPNGWTNTPAVPITGKQFNVFILIGQTNATPPQIVLQPTNQTVLVGQAATFLVNASGTPPLAYQWQRNSTNIVGATANGYTIASTVLSDNGALFRCVVTNAFGSDTSVTALLTVTNDHPPVATMTLPPGGTLYSGGDTILFAGTGTDQEDGNLPPSAFTWKVDFYHDGQVSPFVTPTSGVTNGSFTIPATGETSTGVWYRIALTVQDSVGQTNATFRDVLPRMTTVTFDTVPAALQIRLDAQPVSTSTSVVGVAGLTRGLGAFTQISGGAPYIFDHWSDGGTSTHNISWPSSNMSYLAVYRLGTNVDRTVGYWNFDEGSGLIAYDSSPTANHGTLLNGATWATGKIGSALSLDGVNGYAQVATNLNQWLGGTASLSAWIKTTQAGGAQPWVAPGITGVEAYGSDSDIFWGWIDSTGRIGIQPGNGASAKSTNPINDGQWHHIGLTRDAATGEIKVYVDGVPNGTAMSDIGNKTTPFYGIGRIEQAAYFRGLIDDLRIYNFVLSASDVQVLATINQPPTVNPGSNQTIALPAVANLAGSVVDDGLPNPPGAVSVAWSKISGPYDVSWGDSNALNTTASFAGIGTYTLCLTASDGQLTGNSNVTVTVNLPAHCVMIAVSSQPDGSFKAQFTGSVSGLAYTVEASTNLSSWTTIGSPTGTPPGSGLYEFIDSDASSMSNRFYRIRTSY